MNINRWILQLSNDIGNFNNALAEQLVVVMAVIWPFRQWWRSILVYPGFGIVNNWLGEFSGLIIVVTNLISAISNSMDYIVWALCTLFVRTARQSTAFHPIAWTSNRIAANASRIYSVLIHWNWLAKVFNRILPVMTFRCWWISGHPGAAPVKWWPRLMPKPLKNWSPRYG